MKQIASDDDNKQQYIMINPYTVWEKFYYSIEDGLTKIIRDSVNTQGFANRIDFILNSYLQQLKFQKSVIDNFMEDSPFSSKRDVSRVAELIVAMENKIDNLENGLNDVLFEIEQNGDAEKQASSAESMDLEEIKDLVNPALTGIQDLGQRLQSLEKAVERLEARLNAVNPSGTHEVKSRAKNTGTQKKQKPQPQE